MLGSHIRLAGLESGVPDTTDEQLALHLFHEAIEVLELIGRTMIVRVLGGKFVKREVFTFAIILQRSERFNDPEPETLQIRTAKEMLV
jgi:hypothetical protein